MSTLTPNLNLFKIIPSEDAKKPLKAKQGYTTIFENQWKYIKDYRGQKVINLESEMTSSVDYLRDIKQGYMLYSDYIKTDEYKKRQKIEKHKTNLRKINSKIFELQQDMQIEEIKGNNVDTNSTCHFIQWIEGLGYFNGISDAQKVI